MRVVSSFNFFRTFWMAMLANVVLYSCATAFLVYVITSLDEYKKRAEIYNNQFVPIMLLHLVYVKMQIVMVYIDQFSQTFNFDHLGWIIFGGIVLGIELIAVAIMLIILLSTSKLPPQQLIINGIFLIALLISTNWIVLLLFTAYNMYSLPKLPLDDQHDIL